MNKITKIISLIIGGMILVISCNDKGTDSPFGEILNQPPFDGLTDSIKQQPNDDELYFRRAVLLNKNDLPEPALADFQKAWALKKEERYAFGIGNLLLEKKPDSAIIFLNEAISELPNSFLLPLTLARSFDAQNKTEEALKICNDMLRKNPEWVDVLKMKAEFQNKKGNIAEAISTLSIAYQLTPSDVKLNYMLALMLAETGNKQVIALCDSLIQADSLGIHAEPSYYKGIYYSTINEKAKAVSFFNDAIKKDYNFLEGYIEKGSMLYDMKKYQEALKVLNLCLTISPKFADAYYWIAKCQEAMGQKEDAKINYQRAYSLDNNLTEAKAAFDKLK